MRALRIVTGWFWDGDAWPITATVVVAALTALTVAMCTMAITGCGSDGTPADEFRAIIIEKKHINQQDIERRRYAGED